MKKQQSGESAAIALYIRLARVFRERILQGQWRPGERLPTVDALSTQFDVAVVTARQAIALLVGEGLLNSARGRGIFVAQDVRIAIDDPALRSAINDRYEVAPGQTIRVLNRRRALRLPPTLALSDDDDSRFTRIRKIHLQNNKPFALLESYVAQDVFERFPSKADAKFKIQRLIREAGVEIALARQEVTVSHATPDVAELLDYVMGGSLIRLRSWRFSAGGQVIYATVNLYRGDLFVLDYVESQGAARAVPWLILLTRYR